jgi:hypothetical protein
MEIREQSHYPEDLFEGTPQEQIHARQNAPWPARNKPTPQDSPSSAGES